MAEIYLRKSMAKMCPHLKLVINTRERPNRVLYLNKR